MRKSRYQTLKVPVSESDLRILLSRLFKPEHQSAVITLYSALGSLKPEDCEAAMAALVKEAQGLGDNLSYVKGDKIFVKYTSMKERYIMDKALTKEKGLIVTVQDEDLIHAEVMHVTPHAVEPYSISFNYANEGKRGLLIREITEHHTEAVIECLSEEFPGD